MWPRLKKQIIVELEQLHRLINRHLALAEKSRHEPPNETEIDALATWIHSFYSGIENIFKRVSIEIDEKFPAGEAWHAELLEAMAKSTVSRPAVISIRLKDSLKDYLIFRHRFRHAYAFELQWSRMASLVFQAREVFDCFESEVEQFVKSMESKTQ